MANKLKGSPVIWKLANDLGIKSTMDPVNDVLTFTEKKIKSFLKEYPKCSTLSQLLIIVAAKVKTTVVEVRSDEELETIQQTYVKKGEKIFATLQQELSDEVYGITFRLQKHESWENEFLSLIDCRGTKAARAYFTKWHEIAHLLILTDQQRFQFRRTYHKSPEHDPEEAMIDLIAGRFGYYKPIISKHASGEISFEQIESLSAEICPDTSYQAALIGFVKGWSQPCLLLNCQSAYKKDEQAKISQGSFDFYERPVPTLRAVKVTPNTSANDMGLRIHTNMRVPESSVIYSVFNGESAYAEADENLSLWETSSGQCLSDCNVKVMAKWHGDGVYAIISPSS